MLPKIFLSFSLILSCLTSLGLAFASDTTQAQYIPSRDYGRVLVEEINKAHSSIIAYCYLFALYPNRSESQTMRIAKALADAEKRGVRVEVILNNSIFANGEPVESMQADNREAYEFLRAQGIEVFFSDTSAALHAKAVVLDSFTVIAGSANISEAAMGQNIEASVLVRSKSVAHAMLLELGHVSRKLLATQDTTCALLPAAFLTDTSLLGRMIRAADERAFDTYLYLRKETFRKPDHDTINLNYAALASSLGIDSMTPEYYRRQINKTLDKLQNRYRLLSVATTYGRPAQINLKAFAGQTVSISSGYWMYGWQKKLGFSAKVMTVLGFYYAAISPMRPRWSAAQETLASKHGMSPWFVSSGTVELRRANLLDVEFDTLTRETNESRRPNIYTPLPFYDPLLLNKKWKELEASFGKDKTNRARQWATLVYKDADWRAVEQFIKLEQRYGLAKLEKVAAMIGLKAGDNPRRCVGYFVNTVISLP